MIGPAVFTVVFFVLAPGTMAGLVPWLITGWDRPQHDLGPLDAVGMVLVALGLAMVVACFARFVSEGRGTPAPVAPTKTLVVGGLYRYVRNPMYVGVASAITGQAVLFRNWGVAVWLAVFLAAVVSFVKGYEEPRLAQQFGESYERYRRAVPGWWPRLTAYRP
jgi:protein-S-isoprenylcysteine O-methyltransferase Ste14